MSTTLWIYIGLLIVPVMLVAVLTFRAGRRLSGRADAPLPRDASAKRGEQTTDNRGDNRGDDEDPNP